MNVAFRNLLREPLRLALSVCGVALAVMLILLLQGFLSGMYAQISAYLQHAPGVVVVAQDGVSNLLGATSMLPPGALGRVRAVQGVSEAVPILSQFVILDLHGKKQPVYLVGYDPDLGGGPWRIAFGGDPLRDDQMVFDEVLARRHGFRLGDKVEIAGRAFTIVGLSRGTTSWMTGFLFINKSAAEALVGVPGAVSFIFTSPSAGLTAEDLANRLEAVEGVNALAKKEVISNDTELFAKVFSAPLRLMVGIAFLIGSLVVGMVIYAATVERRHEYGVLKAIGASNGRLYGIVTTQALIAATAGSFGGLGLALAAARLIMDLRPQFLIAYEPAVAARALLAGIGMALVAAFFPARLLAALAPADVFRR